MTQTKAQKETTVEKLEKILESSPTVAFVNFKKLGVSDTTAMRSALREKGVGYTVAKKTLIRRVLDGQKIAGERPELPGELALAYLSAEAAKAGGEETEPARGVYEFGKSRAGALTLLGGIFEGRYVGADEMNELARIPGLDVLRGMFVNLINSPIQRCAIALNQIAESRS